MRTNSLVVLYTLLVVMLVVAPLAVAAGGAERSDAKVSYERAHDAGTVEGYVLSVDRAHGVMRVQAEHATYDIMILPSTSIARRGGEFHSIADIRARQRVQVLLSRRGSVYFAQIIRLRDER